MNVCTSQVASKVKFSNQQSVLYCLLLYSSTGYQIFKHGFPISKHVRACRRVKIGPGRNCTLLNGDSIVFAEVSGRRNVVCFTDVCHVIMGYDRIFYVGRQSGGKAEGLGGGKEKLILLNIKRVRELKY